MRILLSAILTIAFGQCAFGITHQFSKNYVTADFGYTVMPIIGKGFSIGTSVDSNSSFEFSYSQGEKNVTYAEMEAQYYSLKYKRKIWNSLYMNGGIAFKNVADTTTDQVSKMFTAERFAKTYGVDFSVGQRWRSDEFVFGVDWLGIFQPLSVEEKRNFKMNSFAFAPGQRPADRSRAGGGRPGLKGGGHSRPDYDRHENDWNRLSHYATVQLLKAYIGWAF